ncbi:hypothetical protein [Parafrankia soli]|uniref:hypothetical protein n=1 Tax=Parafrankia soli TaxID=2599596 RepID=UPI003B5882C4
MSRPSRRVFSTAYKLRIVTEYESAPHGEKGAILRREGLFSQTRERRAQATHPPRVRPELTATGPDQIWPWDISPR